MAKRKPRHFNALSVGRIARYAKRDGANRCEIVAMVLFALGFGDLACRALKYINIYDLIVPTAKVAMDVLGSFMLIRGAIASGIKLLSEETLMLVADAVIAVAETIENLPTVISVPAVVTFLTSLHEFLIAIEAPLSFVKKVFELVDWDEAYEKWYRDVTELEDVAVTRRDLECICNAYKRLSNGAINELEKPI